MLRLPDGTFVRSFDGSFHRWRLIANRLFIRDLEKKMRGGDAKDTGILTVGRRVKFIK
jgi:hypothetical protein